LGILNVERAAELAAVKDETAFRNSDFLVRGYDSHDGPACCFGGLNMLITVVNHASKPS
jgi:hypothetical protein